MLQLAVRIVGPIPARCTAVLYFQDTSTETTPCETEQEAQLCCIWFLPLCRMSQNTKAELVLCILKSWKLHFCARCINFQISHFKELFYVLLKLAVFLQASCKSACCCPKHLCHMLCKGRLDVQTRYKQYCRGPSFKGVFAPPV